jgi:hypothetical protein
VLAHSLGSAFALAWGPAPHDRLAVIVIASGMGPLQPGEPFHSGSRADNLYWRLARRQATWLLDPLCRLSGAMVARAARGDPQRSGQGQARRLPDRRTTQRVLARPGAQPVLIEDLQESYRQGITVMAADLLRVQPAVGLRSGGGDHRGPPVARRARRQGPRHHGPPAGGQPA